MNNCNYYNEFLKDYIKIRTEECNGGLPKLLIHVCCGSCSIYPLIFLSGLFEISIFFTNSNIYPFDEYNKRLNALNKYLDIINDKLNNKIQLIVDKYDYKEYRNNLINYKDEKEGKTRCKLCIKKRIERTFDFAKDNGYKYVSSIMSISRNKDAEYINFIGKYIENDFDKITWICSDFKKNNGQDIGVMLSKQYDIYRQNYCGCEFSIRE